MPSWQTAKRVSLACFVLSLVFYVHQSRQLGVKNFWDLVSPAELKRQTKVVAEEINRSVETGTWAVDYLINAPVTEEMVFRGLFVLIPALILPPAKIWPKWLGINWVVICLWILMAIGAHFWATDHWTLSQAYPPLPQAMVFWGGLINGACIIHAPPTPRGRALGMIAAIFLHAAANAFYIIFFWMFF
jgi:hypothetical protein